MSLILDRSALVANTATLAFQTNGANAVVLGSDQIVNCTSNAAVVLPVGTTAQRPTGVNGMVRYNSNTAVIEAYVNNTWTSITT
jgi:hypothetical protein